MVSFDGISDAQNSKKILDSKNSNIPKRQAQIEMTKKRRSEGTIILSPPNIVNTVIKKQKVLDLDVVWKHTRSKSQILHPKSELQQDNDGAKSGELKEENDGAKSGESRYKSRTSSMSSTSKSSTSKSASSKSASSKSASSKSAISKSALYKSGSKSQSDYDSDSDSDSEWGLSDSEAEFTEAELSHTSVSSIRINLQTKPIKQRVQAQKSASKSLSSTSAQKSASKSQSSTSVTNSEIPSTPTRKDSKQSKPKSPRTPSQKDREISYFQDKTSSWILEQEKKLDDIKSLITLLQHHHNYVPPRMVWSTVIPVTKLCKMYPYYMLVVLTTTPATTDKSVISVFENLFTKTGSHLTPQYMVDFDAQELCHYLVTMGRQNKNIEMLKEQAEQIIEKHNGMVPNVYEDLIQLKGVGPKIANILLYDAFGIANVSSFQIV
jgi:endonuclease III